MTMAAEKFHTAPNPRSPRIAPAIGVPANAPRDMTEKPIPIRVPIMAWFFVRLTKTVGGNETKVPEKNPKTRQNTTIPPRLWTDSSVQTRMAVTLEQNTSMFIGPR